jgi:drug/metabolite transporter (DMT)-like permease
MTWFWLSIAAAFLWSINNHLDKFLAERYYRHSSALPGTLMFLSSLIGACIAITVFVFDPTAAHISTRSQLLMLCAGFLDFIYVFPYILALMREEASRVAPLFEIAPLISGALGWAFLHERLNMGQLAAMLLIIMGATLISLDINNHFRLKRSVLLLMLASASFWALETFLFKFVAIGTGFWSAILYQYSGVAIAGLILALVSQKYRTSFTHLVTRHARSVFTLSLLAEGLSTTARVSLSYASLLAPLAFVTVVANTSPFFVIILGVIITIFMPSFGRENLGLSHLAQKIFATGLMFLGTFLLLH